METRTQHPEHDPIPDDLEEIATQIVDASYHVHDGLGPGLLESAYAAALGFELEERGIPFERQVEVPLMYKGRRLPVSYRADLVVDSRVLVELKAVDAMLPVHEAQVLTYLKLLDQRLGFLVNFNVVRFKRGIRRLVL